MTGVYTYNPKEVTLVIGGYIFTGWQTITIAKSVKTFTPIRGIRGKNTRVRNRDTSATITIVLLQTSQGNDVFSQILEQDINFGTALISLSLQDGSGSSVFDSSEAYVTGFPVTTYSGQFEYRTWEIFCQSTGSYTVAGNSNPSNSLLGGLLDSARGFFS
ncbi:hypothetical protein D3C86_1006010 [compost metagenome]